MKVRALLVVFLGILASVGTAGARGLGDPEIGKQKFRKCLKCHEISPGAKGPDLIFVEGEFRTPVKGRRAVPLEGPIPGPPLFAFWERPIASFEKYPYSESFVQYSRERKGWTGKALKGFLNNPTRFLRNELADKNAKSTMNYKVRREQDVADILAYIFDVAKKAKKFQEQNEEVSNTDKSSAKAEDGMRDKTPSEAKTN